MWLSGAYKHYVLQLPEKEKQLNLNMPFCQGELFSLLTLAIFSLFSVCAPIGQGMAFDNPHSF
jgi:hypothetical protein